MNIYNKYPMLFEIKTILNAHWAAFTVKCNHIFK